MGNREWSDIAALSSLLAVICAILAFFRVLRPVPLLAVAAVAFGFAAVIAVRVEFTITFLVAAVLAAITAVLAVVEWGSQ